MKSKFAKFVDFTLGALLLFGAVMAVACYILPTDLSAFLAASVTATAYIFSLMLSGKNKNKLKFGKAAENMFFEFMFLPAAAPAKLLCKGLKAKGLTPVVHGDALYLKKSAAFFSFGETDERAVARMIARAKHYGAERALLFCRFPPEKIPDIDFSVNVVCGDDVYKLFASLEVLPETKYSKDKKRRIFSEYRGALSKDKIARYAVLSASLFAICAVFGFSIITTICASVCAALFLISLIFTLVKSSKKQ